MQNAVGEVDFGEDLAHIVGILHNLRVTHRYGGLDCSGLALHAKPQTFGGIPLHLGSRFIFGFDHYRGATGGGNQNVCVAARIVGEGLGVLGADFTARHHPPQQLAQGVVGVWLRLARHTTSLSDSLYRIDGSLDTDANVWSKVLISRDATSATTGQVAQVPGLQSGMLLIETPSQSHVLPF